MGILVPGGITVKLLLISPSGFDPRPQSLKDQP